MRYSLSTALFSVLFVVTLTCSGQSPTNTVTTGYATNGSGATGSTVSTTGNNLICDIQCTTRSDCQAGQRCCYAELSNTQCVNTERCSQTIPSESYLGLGNCAIYCTDDEDCRVGLQCLKSYYGLTPGGTLCSYRMTESPREITSPHLDDSTVPPSSCPHTCDSDAACASNEKCCKNDCGGTQCYPVDVVHPGQFPANPVTYEYATTGSSITTGTTTGYNRNCEIQCTTRSQCSAGQRCCYSGWYSTHCVNTERCSLTIPPGGYLGQGQGWCTIYCTDDEDCDEGKKCHKPLWRTTLFPGGTECRETVDSDISQGPEITTIISLGSSPPKSQTPGTVITQVVHPGQCPSDPLTSGYATAGSSITTDTTIQNIYEGTTNDPRPICYIYCTDRSQCNAGQRCCYDRWSGVHCVNTERCSQTIPPDGYLGHSICPFYCTDDEDCGNGAKCVKSPHLTTQPGGTECIVDNFESDSSHGSITTPMSSLVSSPPNSQTPAPPVCPVFDPNATCGGNGDKRKPYTCDPAQKCSNGGKCCQYECQGTRCETDLCPAPNISIHCFAQESRDCNKSSDCGEDTKCCEIHCGGTRCFPRAAPGALVCPNKPNIPPITCTPALHKRSCTEDSQCGNKKCCDTGCDALKICQTPVRQGSCPVIKVECRKAEREDTANQCGTDMGCRGNQKCCQYPCPGFGTRCMDPAV